MAKIFKFATEAITEELFTNVLGGIWRSATGAISGVAKEKIEAALSSKGMMDNALALENIGVGMPDPTSEELKYFLEALERAGNENKVFMKNIILVVGWPITPPTETKEEKKEDEDKKPIGFEASKKKKEKEKKKKAKWPGRLRALCHKAENADEVYRRMKVYGLLDPAPNGKVDELFLYIKKNSPEVWDAIKKFGVTTGRETAEVVKEGAKDFRKGFLNPFSIFKK